MFDLKTLYRPNLALDTVHDGRHQLENKPFARESIPYVVMLPDHGIAFFTYTWVDKDSNAGAALAVFGPGVGPTPIQQGLADRPVPADMNFDNWQIEGFSMKQDLAFNKAEISWKNDNVELAFTYEAFHPPYAYGANKDGCQKYVATDRIEQSGTAVGFIRIGDRTINFETTAHRDHSWGTRDWQVMQHYQWFQGQCGANLSVHFWRMLGLGKTQIRGYVYKDNLMAEVTDVEMEVNYDDQLLQQDFQAVITDEAGRKTVIEGSFYGVHPLIPHPELVLNEGAARVTYDGLPGPGWMEVAWPARYLEHVRANGPY